MKVLLIGSQGRMGLKMQEQLKKNEVEYVGVDKANRADAENFDYDVVVDFSSSSCLEENLQLALKNKAALVLATTNHDERNLKKIDKAKKQIPIFISSNFSILFNVLLSMMEKLPIEGFEIAVEEVHHKHKVDTPSGSCKEILKILTRMGATPQVCALRVGEVVGEHTVSIYGENEVLKISHNATDRAVFCRGVMEACKFVLNKKPGIYGMRDLLKQKAIK